MNDGMTSRPDWEAMYRSACDELEKALADYVGIGTLLLED